VLLNLHMKHIHNQSVIVIADNQTNSETARGTNWPQSVINTLCTNPLFINDHHAQCEWTITTQQ